MTSATLLRDLRSCLDRTESHIERERYRGYDPYDGLTSPLFRLPPLDRWRLGRWGFQQVLKRLPFQIRPLLGIRKGYNPVTLALVMQAYAYLHRLWPDRPPKTDYPSRIDFLVGELARLATPGFAGMCWGYDFDWEARYASIPAFYPTVVATGFVTNALFEVHRLLGSTQAARMVEAAAHFVLEDLNRTGEGDTFCWSYSPADRQTVLNATMKGARLCAQVFSLNGDRSLLEPAAATIAYVANRQREDGCWPYAVSDSRSWADNFHTCYNLDCLDEYERLTGDRQFADTKRKGRQYYLDHFFTAEGAPKYYDRHPFPIDATACGQSLLTLVRFGELDLAGRVATWCLANLQCGDGAFKYQIHRRYQIRIPYLRWSTAWMFLGLSRLAAALGLEKGPHGPESSKSPESLD